MLWFIHTFIESPKVEFTSDVVVFELGVKAILKCIAVSGYPPIHNVTLMKNGQVIHESVSKDVVYTTSGGLPKDIYGLYVCIVNNTVETSSMTILLQHKGLQ